MPDFLIKKLEKQYPNNPHAVWGTLNSIGAVHGNVETKKGREMERKHERDEKAKSNGDGVGHWSGR